MKQVIRDGFLAGVLIGIGCIVNVISNNAILGSFLFSLALLSICMLEYSLCTGAFGYMKKFDDIKRCLVMLIFNIAGVAFICYIVANFSTIEIDTSIIVQQKLNEIWYDALVRGFGCGILIFIAVQCFKQYYDNYNFMSYTHPLAVIMPVMAFIICGFDHCIANYGYLVLNDVYWTPNFIYWVIGNIVGSLFVSKIQI